MPALQSWRTRSRWCWTGRWIWRKPPPRSHSVRSGRSENAMLGVPLGELAVLAAAIVIGGVVTGLLAGLFGVGGGAVIVPVLYEIFRALGVAEEVRMQLCVG